MLLALNARELKSRARLDEVVGRFTKLRRSGRQLVGLCPFHRERNPSFYVDPQKKVFHCFGCGADGDLFDFVMRATGCDFRRALEIVAEFLGVASESEPRSGERFRAGVGGGLPPAGAQRRTLNSQFHPQSRAEILAALDETNRRLLVIEAANHDASSDLDLATACEPERGAIPLLVTKRITLP
jgi:hypothetical protein